MRYKLIVPLLLAVVVSACATPGRYTGSEYYFTKDGVEWSCRPHIAGTCKPESEWEDG